MIREMRSEKGNRGDVEDGRWEEDRDESRRELGDFKHYKVTNNSASMKSRAAMRPNDPLRLRMTCGVQGERSNFSLHSFSVRVSEPWPDKQDERQNPDIGAALSN